MDLAAAQQLWDPDPGWLNTASYGLPPRPGWEQLQQALTDWRHGRTSWEQWSAATDRSRELWASLVGVDPADVATGATVSQLLAPVAAALPDRARVVVPDGEFSSAVYPWLAQHGRGVTVRTAPLDALADAVAAGADVVAFSLVQSATGAVAAYQDVVAAARESGAWVVVDATQACGWLPFDAGAADAVVVGGYKWLMAPRGTAFAYLHPRLRERLVPDAAGWFAARDSHAYYYFGQPMQLADDARAFDISPAWFSYVGAVAPLELLGQLGLEVVRAHNVGLANRFRTGLDQPPGDSAIVTVDVPGAEEKLARAGIRAAVRAGAVRASFHLYSTAQDVDRAVAALKGR